MTKQGVFPAKSFFLGTGIAIAALVVTIIAKELGWLPADIAKRMAGLIFGAMLVIGGNALPKLGALRAFISGNQARAIQAELMAGAILCFAGIVVMAIFAFASLAKAPLGAALIGLAAFFLALANWLWLRPGKPSSNTDPETTS